MAETLRELVVALSLDSSNFSRNMRTINQQIKEAESTFRQWEFHPLRQDCWYVRYENVMPEKMDHAAAIERAIQLAEDKAGDEKEWTRDMLYANALFSYKEDWWVSKPEDGAIPAYPIPLWEVDLSYYVPGENQARFVAGYMLDEDGNVLAERDSETRIFK